MTFNLASKNILLSPNDKLSIPLPLPYNGSIYSEEDIKKFMESSIQKSRQPVIIFGGNWCPDCRILDGTLQIPTIQKFINDHYDVMHIDVGRYDKNMELMDFFGIVKEKGSPKSLGL
jgi:thiol-disulfide isomerase/thioredoxin